MNSKQKTKLFFTKSGSAYHGTEGGENESGKRMRLAAKAAQLGFFVWHVPSDQTSWENEQMYEILGQSPQEGQNKKTGFFGEFIYPKDKKAFEETLFAALQHTHTFQISCRIIRKNDGKLRWVEFHGEVELSAGKTPLRLIGVLKDITERKRLESERDRFFKLGPDLQVLLGRDGYLKWVSPAFRDLLGWTSEELISQPWKTFVHPEDVNPSIEETKLIFAGKTTLDFENRFRHKNGEYRWLEWKAKTYPEDDVIYGTATDITERKFGEQTQQFLIDLTAQLAGLSKTEEMMQLIGSSLCRYLNANRCLFIEFDLAEELASVTSEWFEGELVSMLGHYQLNDFVTPDVLDLLKNGQLVVIEDTRHDPRVLASLEQYEAFNIRASLTSPYLRDSLCRYAISFSFPDTRKWLPHELRLVEDVANRVWPRIERARTEDALRHSEKQLRLLTDALPVLISYTDKQHHYRLVNRTYTTWFGIPKHQIIGSHLRNIIGESAYQSILPHIEKVLGGEPVTYEQLLTYKNAGERYVIVNYVPDISPKGEVEGYYVLVQDITERKRREANHAFLAEMTKEVSGLSTAADIIQMVSSRLSHFLQADGCIFASNTEQDESWVIDYLSPANGTQALTAQNEQMAAFLASLSRKPSLLNEALIVTDTQTDPRISSESCQKLGLGAFFLVPYVRHGEAKYLFMISQQSARKWREDENELIKEKASRLFLQVERTLAEEAIRKNEARLGQELTDTLQLQRISTQLIQENDIHRLYEQIMDASLSLMKSDMTSLQMLNSKTGQLELLAWRGFHPDSAAFWQWVSIESGSTCGESLRSLE
ncbi:MAG: PAS domain S-box protein, partial [Cyclobacteriaceae bacterium]